MRRCIVILFLLTLSLAASAQYVHRKGGHMTRDKEIISLEEQQQILSDINGVDYTGLWKDYNTWRKTGLGLTIGGSVVAGGGALTFLTGALVSMLGAAVGAVGGAVGGSIGGSEGAQSGAQAGAEAGVQAGQPIMTGGLIAMGVGAVALGAGIPVLVVNCKRMNRITADYNATLPEPAVEEPAAEDNSLLEVAFGPAPSGVGLTLRF